VRHDRRRHGLEGLEALFTEGGGAGVSTVKRILDDISIWTIPVLLVGIPLIGMIRGIKVYDAFIDGAKEGFNVAVRIIPFLVGILVAIGMFRGSGAMDLLTAALRPMLQATGFPVEIFPLVILRTLSGSGSLALATDIIKRYGADSVIARMAATIYGGSETTFYVIAVYFGAIGVKRTRHAIPSALIGDVVAAIVAVAVCSWLF
jgi:spore maturation protein B